MKYYRIGHSVKEKEIGKFPQIKEGKYMFNVKDERYIGNSKYYLKKIDFSPLVPDLVLWKSAKPTDLLSANALGIIFGFVISNKLKEIFEKYNTDTVQFFKIDLYKKNILLDNYWFMKYCNISNEHINFSDSEIWEVENSFTKVKRKNVTDYNDFIEAKEKFSYPRSLHIFKIRINENTDKSFFVLSNIEGGYGLFVSENLKNKIENAGCTGIIFKELNESYP
ncbi:MAG: hypothetical protein ABS68_00815 [Niastella sp. SCN 39-18]|nr:hypothetical protein [Sphingobacteriales bacterium]ODT54841.1 MAG: hypothetical protein ABS68_00815 [Niastella sp. SCN 39-18]OJW07121.1 MAG: hypothetical protein BGO53_05605 [Sphingobacteriales bacterium 39-19]